MVDGKRGRPAMTQEQKDAAKAAREARTPAQIEADKKAREAKKAAKEKPAAAKPPKQPKAAKPAAEPKPAKPKNEAPKRATAPEEPHPMDPNLLTNDQREGVFLSQMRTYDTTEAEQKKIITAARATLAQARDNAKAAYGKDFLKDRDLYKRFTQPNGKDILVEMFTGAAFVARTADIVLTRDVMDLFGEDRTPHLDKMFRDGKRAALAGLGPTAPGTLNGQSSSKWTEGWHAGDHERQKMEAAFTAKQSAPSDFAKHAPPKVEEPPLPLGDPLEAHRAEGAEAFASGAASIPPTGLSDAASEAWVDGFNSARDDKPAPDAATVAVDWQKQGELAFANGEGNSPPDAVPMNERGSWRAGWNKASAEHLQAKRDAAKAPKPEAETARSADPEAGAADAFTAGVQHRAAGGGGAAPHEMENDDREEWLKGWRHQDQAMQTQRAEAQTAH